ncbi:GatB/YqeY domain-containing protein [Pseudomonadota bacterium]|nr:GatB/YqeY domain-containing protein [Pseudomonadota bacterium]
MSLKSKITEEIKNSLKNGDKDRVSALRLLLAAIKQREIDSRQQLSDVEVIQIITKLAKQRKESIDQYLKANRTDLVQKEELELKILSSYLPSQIDDNQLKKVVEDTLLEIGSTDRSEMGKVMGVLTKKLKGQADMGKVSKLVKEKLIN